MARQCNICTHPNRVSIDRALIDRVPNRRIAAQHGLSEAAVRRHKTGHLAEILAAAVDSSPASISRPPTQESTQPPAVLAYAAEHVADARAAQSDLLALLAQIIGRVVLASDAIDDFLRDPEDPSRYTLDARASEVSIVWEDYGDMTEGKNPRPRRKRGTLQELLTMMRRLDPEIIPLELASKHADPRELLVKISAEIRGYLMPMLDKLYGAEEVAAFQEAVLAAIAEASPAMRQEIEKRLRNRAALAGYGR